MKYLNLIRYKNLIFITILMCLMRYSVIEPWLMRFGFSVHSSGISFLLLVLATILIAAGGYVINDYFDTKIDMLNRPDKVIVGNTIPRETASRMHQILTATGVVLGLVVAFMLKSLTLGLIFIIVPGLLWFYSASYKRQFLIGNIIIAFCSALVPFSVVVAESSFLTNYYPIEWLGTTPVIPTLYKWVCGFALFAFLVTLIREIIKDMEDEYGDREQECRTMPVVWGLKKTKIFVISLVVFTMLILSYIVLKHIQFPVDKLSVRYLIGMLLAFACLIVLLVKAKTPGGYGQASTFTKFIMVLGMLYSIALYFILAMNYDITIFGILQLASPN